MECVPVALQILTYLGVVLNCLNLRQCGGGERRGDGGEGRGEGRGRAGRGGATANAITCNSLVTVASHVELRSKIGAKPTG